MMPVVMMLAAMIRAVMNTLATVPAVTGAFFIATTTNIATIPVAIVRTCFPVGGGWLVVSVTLFHVYAACSRRQWGLRLRLILRL